MKMSDLKDAILAVTEDVDYQYANSNSTEALTGAIASRLDKGLEVMRRKAADDFKARGYISEAVVQKGN